MDDDPVFRSCYRLVLQQTLGVTVVAVANPVEARQVLEQGGESLRVAVLCVKRADVAGAFEPLDDIRQAGKLAFALSGDDSAELALLAMSAGFRWFYLKAAEPLRLLACAIANALRGELDEEQVDIPSFWKLTDRAAEVTTLEFQGYRTENVAAKLEIAEPTVRRHRSEVLAKAGIPYWPSALAFLRAWQTPRPPHLEVARAPYRARRRRANGARPAGSKGDNPPRRSKDSTGSSVATRSKKPRGSKKPGSSGEGE